MKIRILAAAFALAGAGLIAPSTALAAAPAPHHVERGHACTLTSTHKCIRGGQFCPQKSYGKAGWDAKGRKYICKGDRTHPHWMK